MKTRTVVLVMAVALGLSWPARADIKTAGRAVLKKHQDAIVHVKLALKTGSSETQAEIAGVVLTPTGLTVVSDFTSNPGGLFSDDTRTETTDVKLVLRDGKEIPAKFVLRDKDLDLAFVQPKETEGLSLPHLKLEKTPQPEPLDEILYLHRLGRGLNREACLAVGRLEAVVKRPRLFLVPDMLNGLQNLGCPAFDDQGRPVGIVVVRRAGKGLRIPQGVQDILDLLKPVIVSNEEVLQVMEQINKQE